MRSAYSWLPATIERIVERIVFADVVYRYRSYVKIGKLKEVVGFPKSECDVIQLLFKKCSDVTDAHDAASGKQSSIPSPKDLEQDIIATKSMLAAIKLRKKSLTP